MIISNMTFTKAMDEFVHIVENSIYTPLFEPKITSYLSKEPLSFKDKEKGKKVNLSIGDVWGERYDCAWFHVEATITKDYDINDLYLIIDMSGEGCVYTEKGVPYRGLTTRCAVYEQWIGKHHKKACEIAPFIKGDKVDMWIDCGANDMLGSCYNSGILLEASISLKNQAFFDLNYDIDVFFDLSKQLCLDDPRRSQIEFALYEASKCVPTGAHIRSGVNYIGSPDNTKEIKRGTTEQALKARKILAPMLSKKAGDTAITHHMVGHSHIDLAWLWPIRETKRKCLRTFSTVMRNMETYPEYKYVQSQAQAYAWVKELSPDLFSQIKERVKEGRWEVAGGMWVEADGNVASGESFVRQFLYGKKFYKEEFGVDCKVCHLPDTFGYNGQLPQLIKDAGMGYFLFQKLMVNIVNKFPYNSFIWKGIDGSEILCHMPPCNTYESNALPECNLRAERNYAEKGQSSHVLSLYGIGDGGSGPGVEHLERIKRQKNLQGVGRNKQSSSLDFFKALDKERENFNTWYGEMYLEFHQGTLTTQAKNKKYNRKMELALRDAEILSVYAKHLVGLTYPKKQLERIWKEVLLYQFHDILPGSSIKRVYDESLERYEKLYAEVQGIITNAMKAIGPGLFNTLSFEREETVKIKNKWMNVSLAPFGFVSESSPVTSKVKVGDNKLENDLLKATFTKEGLVSVYDKIFKRNVFLKPGGLVIYPDTTDAWDMYSDYFERGAEYPKCVSVKTYNDGPVGVCELDFEYNNSKINQKVILKPESAILEYDTKVFWQEAGKMLRARFEPDIETDYSRSDIQFGSIKRSTKDFTSWDMAKYEICAHKWIDMSEKDYGFALINDCKYGHYAKDKVMSVNLLRSTSYPDPDADMGDHSFRYGLYPHPLDAFDGGVVEEALRFNTALIGNYTDIENRNVFIEVPDHVVVETIKEAEESENIIVRFYEAKEFRGKDDIFINFDFKEIYLCDILENRRRKLSVKENNCISIDFEPYKVYTLEIVL